jgi:uncharacterized membrane protein
MIWALCAAGLYASTFIQLKTIRAKKGGVAGPSVVKTPRAHLFGEVPNSAFGIAYYSLMAIAAFFLAEPAVRIAALSASLLAAATSAYLAYSLLFVTKLPCSYCWTGHAVNWILPLLLLEAAR